MTPSHRKTGASVPRGTLPPAQAGEAVFTQLDTFESRLLDVAALAHEVSNLLTPLRAHLELALASAHQPERTAMLVRKAIQATDRVHALMCLPDGSEACDLEQVAREVALLFEDVLPSTELRVAGCAGPAAIPAGWLHQILVNLVLNAQAAGARSIEISANEQSSTYVSVLVHDDGCGMRSVDRAGARGGLGLLVCERLLRRCGGRLDIQSEVGKGTRVTLILKRAAGLAAA